MACAWNTPRPSKPYLPPWPLVSTLSGLFIFGEFISIVIMDIKSVRQRKNHGRMIREPAIDISRHASGNLALLEHFPNRFHFCPTLPYALPTTLSSSVLSIGKVCYIIPNCTSKAWESKTAAFLQADGRHIQKVQERCGL